jgi:hypothetical protein
VTAMISDSSSRVWVAAFLLGVIARDALGDPDAAGLALQRRTQAVGQARALGLLAPSSRRRCGN